MKKFALILAVTSLLLPLFTSAQDAGTAADTSGTATDTSKPAPSGGAYQFQREGIFDCNQNGSYAMSVGALAATGGAYVPVADATVELNTGALVYKECILREIVDRESESAGTALLKQSTVTIQTGRNGNPYYVVNPGNEMVLNGSDPAVLAVLKNNTFQKSPFNADLNRIVAKTYETETRSPQNMLFCPIQGDVDAFETAQPGTFSFVSLAQAGNPPCYRLGAAGIAQTLSSAQVGQAYGNLYQQWQWGRGYYPRVDANGNVVTPASIIQSSYQTQLDSSVHRLENANDIGQMIGALYAGITTQIIGDNQGLSGITQSVGKQPSYLDQVAAESAQGLQGAAANAALRILGASQQVESSYYQAANAIGNSLLQSKKQLQSAEGQCWAAIIPKVCAPGTLKPDNTCTSIAGACTTDPTTGVQTCPTGAQLQIATSTAFSQPIIDSKITPFISAAATNIQTSQGALQLISNLIQGVTNTASLDAQRVALQQLDTLVAQHKLHTQTDLQTITQQQSSVADTMSTLLQKTAQTWSGTGTDNNGNSLNTPWDGTTNPGNGWCNFNNSATLASWIAKWTK